MEKQDKFSEELNNIREFDADWYADQFPDVRLSGFSPLEHWLRIGSRLGRPKGPVKQRAAERPEIGEARHPAASFEILGEHASAHRGPGILLKEEEAPEIRFVGKLAVHLHLFHLDMIAQCQIWLASIEVPFDLFVSTADEEGVQKVEEEFRSLPGLVRLYAECQPNRGRDIGPMIVGFGPQLARYDLVIHFHSKKSSHTASKRDWGIQLGHHMFHSREHFAQVLNLFADDSSLGLAFPVYHPSIEGQIKWGANFARAAKEMQRLSDGPPLIEDDLLPFPAGSFFIARTDAIRPLLEGSFALADFEPEAGQIDGTLAHAIERMFTLVSARRGFAFRQIRAEKPHSLSRSYLQGATYISDTLHRIASGDLKGIPTIRHPALAGLRITFFTCATGGYERPLPFEGRVDGARYIFFSDKPEPVQQAQWELRSLAVEADTPIKTARRHKTQPHAILDECDIAVWIDGNIAVTGDVASLIAQTLENDAAFGVVPHPYRSNVKAELSALLDNDMDVGDVLRKQYARYVEEGFPDNGGLTETNFMVMDLRRPEARKALDIWWQEIKDNSRRDQMSFDYACWKAGAHKTSLIETGLSVRADPRFAYFPHGGGNHGQLHLSPMLITGKERRLYPNISDIDSLTVDVVVCVHNSPDDVARCLRSVHLARDPRTRIIVVDDGSQAPTREVIARHLELCPSDQLIRHDTAQGYTKSANVGLKASSADYVILLNSDTIVPNGWIQALLKAGESDPEVGIIGPLSNAATWQSVPLAKDDSGDFAINSIPAGMTISDVARTCARISHIPVYKVPIVNGFCFAIKRKVIDSIGYLDEEAFPQGYGEENDYCLRLSDIGMTCGVALSTYVFHAKSKSFSHERRRILSRVGWESLVKKHGKGVLDSAVRDLQESPVLKMARSRFKALTCRNEPYPKVVGFYLPQFHSFAVNDRNWGPGFSEWRNVVKAKPRYTGHQQPRLPGELGYYDLRTAETLVAQGNMAREFGLSAMAVYYYRFGRERLMNAVTDRIMSMPEGGPEFFYCWANEDWTRAWDGKTSDVILKQDYSIETLTLFVDDLIESFADVRYFRIDDKPIVMIYQLNKLPDPGGAIRFLREQVRERLNIEVMIGSTWNPDFQPEWEDMVDFIVQFPPHRTPRKSKRHILSRSAVPGASEACEDFLESYEDVVRQSLEAVDAYCKLAPGACPNWDNSPRRARNANILVGANPDKFGKWVEQAAAYAVHKHKMGNLPAPFLFINAWNEWAEGAVLEPTEIDGRSYLKALRHAIYAINTDP